MSFIRQGKEFPELEKKWFPIFFKQPLFSKIWSAVSPEKKITAFCVHWICAPFDKDTRCINDGRSQLVEKALRNPVKLLTNYISAIHTHELVRKLSPTSLLSIRRSSAEIVQIRQSRSLADLCHTTGTMPDESLCSGFLDSYTRGN